MSSIVLDQEKVDLDDTNPFIDRDLVPHTETISVDDETGKRRTTRHYAATDVVFHWLTHSRASYIYKTNDIEVNEAERTRVCYSVDRIMRRLILHADKRKVPLQREKAEMALLEWMQTQKKAVVGHYRTLIFQNPDMDRAYELAKVLVRSWTGGELLVDYASIVHFIWQVKRKLGGFEARDHLMPVLVGRQGGGKSEAVRMLIKTVGDLSSEMTALTALADQRELQLLGSNYVLFADEMGKGEKVPVDLLKNAISGVFMKQRVMRSTDHVTIKHISTFIGAANNDLSDIIHDTTGMRRFWHIKCQEKLDWDVVNGFDYLGLWQAVDEKAPSPYSVNLAAFAPAQEAELRSKTSVEMFFDDGSEWTAVAGISDVLASLPSGGQWLAQNDLYIEYTNYCHEARLQAFSRPKFRPQIERLGFKTRRGNIGRLVAVKKKAA